MNLVLQTMKSGSVRGHDRFDPNERVVDGDDARQSTVGLNFFLCGRRDKLQVDYVWKHERLESVDNDALPVQSQTFL